MKARDFDEAFDAGDEVRQHLDLSRAIRPNREIKRVNVDFPQWMVSALDDEAVRVPRALGASCVHGRGEVRA